MSSSFYSLIRSSLQKIVSQSPLSNHSPLRHPTSLPRLDLRLNPTLHPFFIQLSPLLLTTGQDFTRIAADSPTSHPPFETTLPTVKSSLQQPLLVQQSSLHASTTSSLFSKPTQESEAHTPSPNLLTWTPSTSNGSLLNIYHLNSHYFDSYSSFHEQFGSTKEQKSNFQPTPRPISPKFDPNNAQKLSFLQKLWRFPSWLFRWILYKFDLACLAPTNSSPTKTSHHFLASPFTTFSKLTFEFIKPTVTLSDIPNKFSNIDSTTPFQTFLPELQQSSLNLNCLLFAYVIMKTYPSMTSEKWRKMTPSQQIDKFFSCTSTYPVLTSIGPHALPFVNNFFHSSCSVIGSYIGSTLDNLQAILVALLCDYCNVCCASDVNDFLSTVPVILNIITTTITQYDNPTRFETHPILHPDQLQFKSTQSSSSSSSSPPSQSIITILQDKLKSFQSRLNTLSPEEEEEYKRYLDSLEVYNSAFSHFQLLILLPDFIEFCPNEYTTFIRDTLTQLCSQMIASPQYVLNWTIQTNSFENLPALSETFISSTPSQTSRQTLTAAIQEIATKYSEAFTHPIIGNATKFFMESREMKFLTEKGANDMMPFSPIHHDIYRHFSPLLDLLHIDKLLVYQAIQSHRFFLAKIFFGTWSKEFYTLRSTLEKLHEQNQIVFTNFFESLVDSLHTAVEFLLTLAKLQTHNIEYDWHRITDLTLQNSWDIHNW